MGVLIMDFIPNTNKQKEEMLKVIGVSSMQELFKDIPADILLMQDLNIGMGLSELEVSKKINSYFFIANRLSHLLHFKYTLFCLIYFPNN